MGLLGSLFGGQESESESRIAWRLLRDLGQFEEMLQESYTQPVVVFKHSTRCSISRMALRQFENQWNLEGKMVPYFLDLLEYRPISNTIAAQLEVIHQSPQVIVIRNGCAVYHASHEGISVEELQQFT
ncbi:bacillithiol system redox-active protein YtxJ [Flavobacterium sp.]|uniref:bacillithiol system redox-active protein YtxJ n=1 Tax=Flavobacterium sp. TaxID=239 RepID=UPI002612954D|nr:bacillithiol system redox-active protein YtxJ [Flavobacterium sp.]